MPAGVSTAVTGLLYCSASIILCVLNISHTAAIPLGMKVKAYAEVTGVNGREITFRVSADNEKGEIGNGVHKRFVVFGEKFMTKTNTKAEK